jgi:hypothetical protein
MPFDEAKRPWSLVATANIKCASDRLCPSTCALRPTRRVSAYYAPVRNQIVLEPLALVHMRPTQHPGGHAAALARVLLALRTGVDWLLGEPVPSEQPRGRFSGLPYVLWAPCELPTFHGCAAPWTLPRVLVSCAIAL